MTDNNSMDDYLISVCLVIRNDSDIISEFLEKLHTFLSDNFKLFEILLVDNHSSDHTYEIIQECLNAFANLRSIRLSRIHARDTAITAALDNCIGDFAVILDPRHDDYRLISQLVERALDNNDVVIVRYDLQETYGFIDRWSAKLVYRVATFLIRQPIHVGDSLYRIYSRRAINALSQVRRKHRYLKSSSSLIGYSEVHITVTVPLR